MRRVRMRRLACPRGRNSPPKRERRLSPTHRVAWRVLWGFPWERVRFSSLHCSSFSTAATTTSPTLPPWSATFTSYRSTSSFPDRQPGEQPVYEEISEMENSVAEYEYDLATTPSAYRQEHYEEPVPLAAYDTAEGKNQPLAFHNPTYGGPFPASVGAEEVQAYAKLGSFPHNGPGVRPRRRGGSVRPCRRTVYSPSRRAIGPVPILTRKPWTCCAPIPRAPASAPKTTWSAQSSMPRGRARGKN